MRAKSKLNILICFLTAAGLFTKAEATTVRVAVPTLSMVVIAFTAAKEKGYYRDEGLDVDLVVMRDTLGISALIGGNADFASMSGAGLTAILGGMPLRFAYTSFYRPMFWLYSRPDIRDVTGLKGKRVAVSGLGSGPATLLLEHLKKRGIEGGRDLTILSMGITPNRFAALVNGSVDAAVLIPPFTFMAEEGGFRELVSFIKEDFVELQGSIILREELLKAEPLLVEKFIRATLKGFRYARENRAETIPILARNTRTTQELAAKDYDAGRPAMTLDGTVNEKLQRAYLEMGLRRMEVKDGPSSEKVFDFFLTKKVLSELDLKKWRPAP